MLAVAVRTATVRVVGQLGRMRSLASVARNPIGWKRRAAYFVVPTSLALVGVTLQASTVPDWEQLREDIAELLDDDSITNPSVDDGVQGGGGYVGPMLLRLAWHCSGTWCQTALNGGSDGATMRFAPECNHGGNAGLTIARSLLEPIKKRHPNVSYADLYILAGVVAVEEMGGPKVPFRWGRTDAPAPACPEKDKRFSPDGRLPDGDKGAQHIRNIFFRMGFDDQGIVALGGAHAVGRCHTDRSGFWGPWTRAEATFSNELFRLLFDEEWTEKKTHKGEEWKGPLQFENKEGDLMMLATDLALRDDPKFRVHAERYKKDSVLFFADFAKYYQQLNELGCENLKDEVTCFRGDVQLSATGFTTFKLLDEPVLQLEQVATSSNREVLSGSFESVDPTSVAYKLMCPQPHINEFKKNTEFITCDTCKRFCKASLSRKVSATFVVDTVGKEGCRELLIPEEYLPEVADKDNEEEEDLMVSLMSNKWTADIIESNVVGLTKQID